jgi:PBP1b-binding outer membrane lipoprotein LpoB
MENFKRLVLIILLTPFFAACSNAPSESTVEGLIEAQYEQTTKIVEDAKANAGSDKMAKAMSGMMENMMPKLERIENIHCDTAEGDNTYLCTADVTQTIAGNSQTNKTNFKVYQVNDEWVLGN